MNATEENYYEINCSLNFNKTGVNAYRQENICINLYLLFNLLQREVTEVAVEVEEAVVVVMMIVVVMV